MHIISTDHKLLLFSTLKRQPLFANKNRFTANWTPIILSQFERQITRRRYTKQTINYKHKPIYTAITRESPLLSWPNDQSAMWRIWIKDDKECTILRKVHLVLRYVGRDMVYGICVYFINDIQWLDGFRKQWIWIWDRKKWKWNINKSEVDLCWNIDELEVKLKTWISLNWE